MGYFCKYAAFGIGFLSAMANHFIFHRRTRLPQVSCASGMGSSLHRGQAQSPRDPPTLRQCRPKDLRPLRRPAKHEQDRRKRSYRACGQHPAPGTLNSTLTMNCMGFGHGIVISAKPWSVVLDLGSGHFHGCMYAYVMGIEALISCTYLMSEHLGFAQ